jgi:hypothetical protein
MTAPEYNLVPARDPNEWILVFPENTTLQGNLELDFSLGLFRKYDKNIIGIHAKGNLLVNHQYCKLVVTPWRVPNPTNLLK